MLLLERGERCLLDEDHLLTLRRWASEATLCAARTSSLLLKPEALTPHLPLRRCDRPCMPRPPGKLSACRGPKITSSRSNSTQVNFQLQEQPTKSSSNHSCWRSPPLQSIFRAVRRPCMTQCLNKHTRSQSLRSSFPKIMKIRKILIHQSQADFFSVRLSVEVKGKRKYKKLRRGPHKEANRPSKSIHNLQLRNLRKRSCTASRKVQLNSRPTLRRLSNWTHQP